VGWRARKRISQIEALVQHGWGISFQSETGIRGEMVSLEKQAKACQ
jgi:hypothetical protein